LAKEKKSNSFRAFVCALFPTCFEISYRVGMFILIFKQLFKSCTKFIWGFHKISPEPWKVVKPPPWRVK
jgi:hypothetical protein